MIDILARIKVSLATERVCVLRYKRHYFMASGIHAALVAAEFLEHANEESNLPIVSLNALLSKVIAK